MAQRPRRCHKGVYAKTQAESIAASWGTADILSLYPNQRLTIAANDEALLHLTQTSSFAGYERLSVAQN